MVTFTFNITFALVILLIVIYARKPLDFALFPTVILIATLLRLSLNVASTRVVLLHGHEGTDAAGQVIKSFGEVVIGGNYAVGLVVFIILVIINFVVVTKGAGRVAEVNARFTLDSMPGKQMAIDADLNQGLIDQEQAKARREEVTREADFYGSMDGASKFVRGDAIAGILITIINVLGGFTIGVMQHDLSASQSAEFFVLLTIGDGLVAQIPGLTLSTAAGIMVTRENREGDMGGKFIADMFSKPKTLGITSGIMTVIGLVPGMPNFAFLTFAAITGALAWRMKQKKESTELEVVQEQQALQTQAEETESDRKELSWDDVMPIDSIGLEVGYRLIPMVDKSQGGQLMSRIKGVRKKLSQDLGFLIPPVHIRDNLDLAPNVYRIALMGVSVGEAEVHPEHDMAINPGQVFGEIDGIKTKDPAFGLPATWIEQSAKENAQTLGYTVVDANTVIATHLSQLLNENATQLLGHEEVQQLLDRLASSAPKLVEDLVPKILPLSTLVKVLQNLLNESIPIRDFKTIIEAIAEYASQTQDAGILTAQVRVALGRFIVQHINGLGNELSVITLEPSLEQLLHQSIQMSEEGGGIEPGLAERIHQSLTESAQTQEMNGLPAILLVSAQVRLMLMRFVKHSIPNMHVLAYNEVPDNMQIKIVSTVGQN
ncbi:MAG: flagellar biosynthesis protein FlhA [gamma proteobacterium symbiont of Bathyaustriella thionipta]|nr:flagellar biosynthesis protein FlhA [gamma proteobacterium symbiont of Bathyaustriella thionipta]MCU7951911.1 flagellar biosynthesis protein FlhA [gamma proteobacterium symbiont of Bathyaustriella thionipta]MCU7957773.1 flagellar biosynthesis protein FlhA [gamma proteobacterium symbiont of Bathyaustriella thionipta]MCU7966843.1 flagellar biosynthesis protein FlhA [gamma proteobacterium symbiont of Bathyaustriella thionipta]